MIDTAEQDGSPLASCSSGQTLIRRFGIMLVAIFCSVSASTSAFATASPRALFPIKSATPATLQTVPIGLYVTGYRLMENPAPLGPSASAIWSANLALSRDPFVEKTATDCVALDTGIFAHAAIFLAMDCCCASESVRQASVDRSRSNSSFASAASFSNDAARSLAWLAASFARAVSVALSDNLRSAYLSRIPPLQNTPSVPTNARTAPTTSATLAHA